MKELLSALLLCVLATSAAFDDLQIGTPASHLTNLLTISKKQFDEMLQARKERPDTQFEVAKIYSQLVTNVSVSTPQWTICTLAHAIHDDWCSRPLKTERTIVLRQKIAEVAGAKLVVSEEEVSFNSRDFKEQFTTNRVYLP